MSIEELAEDLDTSVDNILKICDREGFNLPFGEESYLHESIVENIRNIFLMEDINGDDNNNDDDDESNGSDNGESVIDVE